MKAARLFPLVLLAACLGESPDARVWSEYARIVAVEDARGALPVDPVLTATHDPDPRVRGWAVRALGRLGDTTALSTIATSLTDPDASARIQAAHALAAASAPTEVERRMGTLEEALAAEADPLVRAELAHAVARSAKGREEVARAADALDGVAAEPGVQATDSVAVEARLALARGYDRLARVGFDGWTDRTGSALRLLADTRSSEWSLDAARVRRLAVGALRQLGALTTSSLTAALADDDDGVRRQATMALEPDGPAADWAARLLNAISDDAESVRMEALRTYGPHAGRLGCLPIAAVVNSDYEVAPVLVALDQMDEPCPEADLQRVTLISLIEPALAAVDPAAPLRNVPVSDWQRGAHALLALASEDPAEARKYMDRAALHPSPFFRAWAARAAAQLEDEGTLRRLAADLEPNVRTAALRGLGELLGPAADSVYRAQLGSDDPQLVMTAARLLEQSPEPEAAARAMADAFARFSASRKETVRDVRLALLGAMERSGTLAVIDLRPFVADYDPVVAERVASLLSIGPAEPQPLERLPTPDADELVALSRTSVILEMTGGGEIEIRLRPDWAATNAARFARLAREGYYDGLTFHRVVPNFVVQGGSPGANEYSGADRYTRDELGRPAHWEGTVGVSTRGRDTGDGQIFINLVDNVRLDHDYTVFGEVIRGMDVVRHVLEGDVIRSVTVTEGG